MRLKSLLIMLICFCIFQTSEAQTVNKEPFRYGIYGNYNLNYHVLDFRSLPGVPNCCPQFESGDGSGFTIGGLFDMPLTDMFSLQLRANYMTSDGILTAIESDMLSVDFIPTMGEYEHRIDAGISSIGFEPLFDMNLFGGFSVDVGFRIAYITQCTYDQQEKIVNPADRGVFPETGTSIRNAYSGDIQNVSNINAAIVAGVRYELPMNSDKTLILSPEIFYTYGLTDIIQDRSWTVNTIRAGVAIIYSPSSKPKVLPKIEIEPEVKTEDLAKASDEIIIPEITPKVRAVGVDNDIEEEKPVLRVEEFLSTNMKPLLNYVFFDNNSDVLPERYTRLAANEKEKFKIDDLFDSGTLPTYYHLLNIIGRRMNDNPEANITLTGCNSNIDEELNNTTLSKNRAENVKQYLVSVWGINDKRIKIKARNLPERASNIKKDDGIEENRRVEISSDLSAITAPVITNDTLRTANPPVIRFYPSVDNDTLVADWKVSVLQNGITLKEFSGTGVLPENLDWNIDEDKSSIPRYGENIDYTLVVENKENGEYKEINNQISIEQVTVRNKRVSKVNDKIINNFSLILFKFDSPDISDENEKIVEIIKTYIEKNSEVVINGYSDRMGDDEYNKNLSYNRAKNTNTAINHNGTIYEGIGESKLLYDNNLPEGRFYCRTVEVYVETPVKY